MTCVNGPKLRHFHRLEGYQKLKQKALFLTLSSLRFFPSTIKQKTANIITPSALAHTSSRFVIIDRSILGEFFDLALCPRYSRGLSSTGTAENQFPFSLGSPGSSRLESTSSQSSGSISRIFFQASNVRDEPVCWTHTDSRTLAWMAWETSIPRLLLIAIILLFSTNSLGWQSRSSRDWGKQKYQQHLGDFSDYELSVKSFLFLWKITPRLYSKCSFSPRSSDTVNKTTLTV